MPKTVMPHFFGGMRGVCVKALSCSLIHFIVSAIEEVVNMVIFILSDKSSMTNGQCIRIDGGMSVH